MTDLNSNMPRVMKTYNELLREWPKENERLIRKHTIDHGTEHPFWAYLREFEHFAKNILHGIIDEHMKQQVPDSVEKDITKI